MVLGLLWMLLANAASLIGANELVRRVGTGRPHVDVVLFLILRILIISSVVLLGGIFGVLTATWLGLLSLGALAALFASGSHRHLPRLKRMGMHPLLVAFLVVVAIRLLLQVWFFAPHVGDTMNYYLPKVAEWVQSGRFTREMGGHPFVTFPGGFELVQTWWTVYLHHDVLIEMAGVEFLVIAFAAVYALAKELALKDSWAHLSATLYVLTPGVHLSATSNLNDTPVAALVATTVALVVARVNYKSILFVAGVGMGVKATYGYALPGLLLLWLLLRKQPAQTLKPTMTSIGLPLVGIALAGFWYVRNLLWYGNPVYPFGGDITTTVVLPQYGPKVSSLLATGAALLDRRVHDPAPYGAMMDGSTGWGPVGFALGPIALVVMSRHSGVMLRLCLSFLVSLCSVMTFSIHDPFCLKYVLFFPVVFAVAVAMMAQQNRQLLPLVTAALAYQFVATSLPYDLPLRDSLTLSKQTWDSRSCAVLTGDVLSDDPGVVGFLDTGFGGRSYLLYRPDLSRRVVYLRSRSPAELVEAMRQAGISLLYADPEGARRSGVIKQCLQSGTLKQQSDRLFLLGRK